MRSSWIIATRSSRFVEEPADASGFFDADT
jgi:hypothetical protein